MRTHNLYVLAISILAAAVVLNPPALWSQEAATASCAMAGTWYGGGEVVKYLMTVIPGPGGDYTATADGAYSLDALGFPVKTIWSGSIVKGSGKDYEFFAISLLNKTSAFPAPTPDLQAVHATARLTDCNTLQFDYDFFGGYLWPTDKIPFLSVPDYVVVPPPFSETYHRMPATCTQCAKQ